MAIVQTDGTQPRTPLRPGDSLSESAPAGPAGPRDGITLSDIFASLRRHLLFVFASTVTIGALAALSVFRESPSFRATATLRLTDTRRSMTGALGQNPTDQRQG